MVFTCISDAGGSNGVIHTCTYTHTHTHTGDTLNLSCTQVSLIYFQHIYKGVLHIYKHKLLYYTVIVLPLFMLYYSIPLFFLWLVLPLVYFWCVIICMRLIYFLV